MWRRDMIFPQLLIQFHACLIVILLLSMKAEVAMSMRAAPIAQPGCNDTCGNVSIPFPFGMGPKHCYLDPWFKIECKPSPYSDGLFKPLLSKLNNYEVTDIGVDYRYYHYYFERLVTVLIPPLNSCMSATQQLSSVVDLRGSPYNFSASRNVFVMEGCPGSAVVFNQSKTTMAGCATVCNSSNGAIATKECYGVKCCQAPLRDNLQFYNIEFNKQPAGRSQNCLVATLMNSSSVDDYVGKLSTSQPLSGVPTMLIWNWTNNDSQGLDSHGFCYPNDEFESMYCRCHHDQNYYGNPYVRGGCQVPDECKGCHGHCNPIYYSTSDTPSSYYCEKKPSLSLAAILGLSIGLGVVLSVIGCYGLYRFIKRRREMKKRAKFFKRNGGLLLQQQLSSNEGVVERTKIFTNSELEKATDHFNQNRILGQGGQGTVYKGMLSDGRIVAIKKSRLLDESQLEQFINEVVILSQINHRNVVRLLGCCLETEVPLLVYEYIPNGTLSQHIHDPDEDFVTSWEMRLKIAADSAGAIAYLHSSSSIPIYHRDIKSSNILLDDKNRAKVSDFGCSRTIAIDQTHLTTIVQGTMGYLDPEYFHSYQFTEKSDVYSFGVVLLEILTGKKPIYRVGTMEQKNLVTEFLSLIPNSRLSDILDAEVVKQAKEEELVAVVNLTKYCLNWKGKLRPTMKEVAKTLEMIIEDPSQVSNWNKQVFPYEEFGGNDMTEISDWSFMSNSFTTGASISLHIDGQPLLPETK